MRRMIMSWGIGSVYLQVGQLLQPRNSVLVVRFVLGVRGCPHSGQFLAEASVYRFHLFLFSFRVPPTRELGFFVFRRGSWSSL